MANDLEKRITAKMVLDSSGFNSNIKGINGQLKLTQSQLKNASSEVGLFGKSSEKLKGVQEALAKQVELHAKKVDIYKDSIEKTTVKMNDNIKERDKLKDSLENANRKYDEAIKLYGKESDEAKKAKTEVDELTEEYKKKEKAIESNAKQINNYETNLNKANAELNKTKIELNKLNDELGKSNNKWISASETLRNSSEKLKNIGSNISNAGDKILKISAPLVGAGVASLKFATDFENSIAKVSTISDESEVSIRDLRKQILNLSSDTGIASTEIANNVYDAISAGQKTGDAVNFVANSTKLAKAGFAEAGQSLDVLTTILNAYKMKSQEVTRVSDLLIQVQNKGKVTVGELSSVMGKVIPTAVATNTSLQQLGAGYAIMTSNGIKAAETTTYINSMLNELSKTGTDADKALRKMTGKSFSDLMKQGKSLSDVLIILDNYAKKNKLSLNDMFGSAEAGKAALVLSTNAGNDFNNMLKDMNNVTGETDKAFAKVTNTSGERLKKTLNQLKNEAIRFGDTVAPMLDKGTELLGKITDKLSQMDEEQLKNIASLGMFTVGLGGVLKIGGSVISTVGNIAGGLSKLTGIMGVTAGATTTVGTAGAAAGGATGVGALAAGLGTVVTAAAPFLLTGAAVVGTGYAIKKVMSQEVVPSIDLFANKIETTATNVKNSAGEMEQSYTQTSTKISEETKKAVGAYMELDKNATQSLTNLYVSTTTITNGNSKAIIDTYNQMNHQIKQGFDQHYQERITSLQTFFAESTAISTTEEAEILNKEKWSNEERKASQEEFNQKILEIINRASKEKRTLTADEVREIGIYQNNMRQNAVESLSKQEIESKIILERLKSYSGRITAEQASEVIKNAEKQRQEAVKNAEQEYHDRVAQIIKMRDESGTISAAQADKLIKEAERQREQSILKADLMKQGVVKKVSEMNADIIKDIDTSDGSIKSRWDKLKEWFNNNPIVRTIKTVGGMGNLVGVNNTIDENWTGTSNYRGGLTTLHERKYELYDLPRGTRIFNHEASEELVTKTAESVATKVANSVLSGINIGSGAGEKTIIVPVTLDGREIARVVAPYNDRIQGNSLRLAERGIG
ncbi:phage tail tape measure protein [Clostridium peptidivorans]|uniref:phage tail tape measure protein n=1 Tax=Clostridium peptidivorans TaxID=100174 RepID=UPI000BE24B87|nr:phage tail tape measure protein [Clostridium peptidivorans]